MALLALCSMKYKQYFPSCYLSRLAPTSECLYEPVRMSGVKCGKANNPKGYHSFSVSDDSITRSSPRVVSFFGKCLANTFPALVVEPYDSDEIRILPGACCRCCWLPYCPSSGMSNASLSWCETGLIYHFESWVTYWIALQQLVGLLLHGHWVRSVMIIQRATVGQKEVFGDSYHFLGFILELYQM